MEFDEGVDPRQPLSKPPDSSESAATAEHSASLDGEGLSDPKKALNTPCDDGGGFMDVASSLDKLRTQFRGDRQGDMHGSARLAFGLAERPLGKRAALDLYAGGS